MSLPFFYEPSLPETGTHFTLSEESGRHCIQVLRMKTGEGLQITNGKGLLQTASIVSDDKKKTVVILQKAEHQSPPTKKISIAISLLKNATRFEWFLEKATEIGVFEIFPIISKRTEHTRFRTDRMNGILTAAMLQSQQTWLPILQVPIYFEQLISAKKYAQTLIAHCEKEEEKRFIRDLPSSSETLILIGPEGDFTPTEIQLALEKNYIPISLGETRLRTETAGVVAATLLMNR